MSRLKLCEEVYKDAATHKDLPASVIVFISQWVPWMFRRIKYQQKEIESLKQIIEDKGKS